MIISVKRDEGNLEPKAPSIKQSVDLSGSEDTSSNFVLVLLVDINQGFIDLDGLVKVETI